MTVKTIAIDFETANEERASACSIGVAWLEGGQVVRTEERLIRPKEFRFSPFNIGIHGIHPEDVRDKPEFPDVLSEFLPELSGSLVLAHNAAFDIGVIRATLDRYDMSYPEFNYFCTAKISREVWPDLITTSLPEVARLLGIKFSHHNAAADAYACGEVALHATRKLGLTEVGDIPSRILLVPGRLMADACPMLNKASGRKSGFVRSAAQRATAR